MNKIVLSAALVIQILGTVTLKGAPPEDDVRRLMTNHYDNIDVSKVPEAIRRRYIEQLKNLSSSEKIQYGSKADLLLIDLGDMDTIKSDVKAYHASISSAAAGGIFLLCKQPLVIPLLAGDLEVNEDAKPVRSGEDLLVYPVSVRSANIMRIILINSPQFKNETKKWAEETYPGKERAKAAAFREVFRGWWMQNADAFKQLEYSKVTPPKKSKSH